MSVPRDLSIHTDQHLVELILQNDERAARELVTRYEDQVFDLALDILGDSDAADSAQQETFIKVFNALARYRPEFEFGAWLHRIARNVALDKVKDYARRPIPFGSSFLADTPDPYRPLQPLQVADKAPNPLQQAITKEQVDRIKQMLTTLNPRHREALLMHLEGAPHAEIATRMGVPVNTVNSYILRGRKRLDRAILD